MHLKSFKLDSLQINPLHLKQENDEYADKIKALQQEINDLLKEKQQSKQEKLIQYVISQL